MMLGKTFKRDICRPLLVVGNIAHKQDSASMINNAAFKINKSVIKRQSKKMFP